MSDHTDERILCRVDPTLVEHVRELLSDAEIPSRAVEAPDRRMLVVVPADNEEHARAVIGLVLPQLLADPTVDEPPGGTLSSRLIRSEDEGTPGLPGGLIDGTRTYGYADPLADEPEHSGDFIPPEPPPVPRPKDRIAKAAWFAVIAGPLLLILNQVFSISGLATAIGLALFFGGFATLIYRMEERNRNGDGWDDGAVV